MISRSPAVVLFLTVLADVGCAHEFGPICDSTERSMTRETLYFGRNKPGGGTVSDDEWRGFLNDSITTRFPDGLTLVEARGQWRGATGRVEQEASMVVTIFHNGDAAPKRRILEITSEYMQRFQQEAVLREHSATCIAFQ